MQKSIFEEISSIKKNIREIIGDRKFSVAIDALTTKSMTLSVLGTVVFFVDSRNSTIQRASLDLQALVERHTADYIRQVALESIKTSELNEHLIVRVVSDGASNMKLAFL